MSHSLPLAPASLKPHKTGPPPPPPLILRPPGSRRFQRPNVALPHNPIRMIKPSVGMNFRSGPSGGHGNWLCPPSFELSFKFLVSQNPRPHWGLRTSFVGPPKKNQQRQKRGELGPSDFLCRFVCKKETTNRLNRRTSFVGPPPPKKKKAAPKTGGTLRPYASKPRALLKGFQFGNSRGDLFAPTRGISPAPNKKSPTPAASGERKKKFLLFGCGSKLQDRNTNRLWSMFLHSHICGRPPKKDRPFSGETKTKSRSFQAFGFSSVASVASASVPAVALLEPRSIRSAPGASGAAPPPAAPGPAALARGAPGAPPGAAWGVGGGVGGGLGAGGEGVGGGGLVGWWVETKRNMHSCSCSVIAFEKRQKTSLLWMFPSYQHRFACGGGGVGRWGVGRVLL